MKLRGYQERTVKALPGLLNMHRRVVAVSPTASGKTVIAAALIRKMTEARVLWLVHRVELVRQAYDQLLAAGIPKGQLGKLSGADTLNPEARVLVASVGMFRSRKPRESDLIVVDEAHHVMACGYRSVIDSAKETFVLGLTATPWRLDGSSLGDVFAHLHVVATPTELVAEGAVMAARVFACIDQATAKKMTRGLSAQRGDWSRKKLEKVMRRAKLMGDAVQEWKRLAVDQPTIAFATTVAHAKDLATEFRSVGVTAEVVSWETPDERRRELLAALSDGTVRVLVTVAVLTEGLDCPPVKCIVMARPTKSLTLYLQMIGRGSRVHGARKPIVLDHAGNVWRFGLPEDDVEWSLTGRASACGEAPVKKCVGCEQVIPISAVVCPHCATEQPLSEQELLDREAHLERVKADEKKKAEARKRLEKLAKEKGAPKGWVDDVMTKMFEAA